MTTNPPKFDLSTIAVALLQPFVQQAVDAATEPLVRRLAILEEILAIGSENEDNRLQSLRLNMLERDLGTLDQSVAPLVGSGTGSLQDARNIAKGAHEKIDRIHKDLDERVQNQGKSLHRLDMAMTGLADRFSQRGGDSEIDLDQLANDLDDHTGFRDNLASFVERKFDELHEGGSFNRKVDEILSEQLRDGDHNDPIKSVVIGVLEDALGAMRD
jgi:hypothetical protein